MQNWSRTLALLSLLAATGHAADGVKLEYKFEKDEPLVYSLNMKTNAKFTTPDGGVRETQMTNCMELKQELIEAKPNGSSRIAITIVKANQRVDGKAVAVPIEPGHSILLTMKPNGEVEEGAGDLGGGTQSQLQMVFPEEMVEKGTKWERETMIQDPLPLKAVTKYLVAGIDTEFPGYVGDTVQLTSAMGMENEKLPTGEGVNSSTKGTIWFDAERGRIVRSEADSTFHISIPIQLQNVLPPNSTVKIDFDIHVDITLCSVGDSSQGLEGCPDAEE